MTKLKVLEYVEFSVGADNHIKVFQVSEGVGADMTSLSSDERRLVIRSMTKNILTLKARLIT